MPDEFLIELIFKDDLSLRLPPAETELLLAVIVELLKEVIEQEESAA